MQERDLFEYAVLRLVPRVEREEFLNIGVILYCRRQKFLDVRIGLDETRIHAFCKDIDIDLVRQYTEAFRMVCLGEAPVPGPDALSIPEPISPIALLEPAERFRWLTAKRSSILQVSAVHPGLCPDALETLEKLYRELVIS